MLNAEGSNDILRSSSRYSSSLPLSQTVTYLSKYDKYMDSEKETVSLKPVIIISVLF